MRRAASTEATAESLPTITQPEDDMAAQLALIDTEGQRTEVSGPDEPERAELPIRPFYDRYVEPQMRDDRRAHKTFLEDRSHLKTWERFLKDTRIASPSVFSVTAEQLSRFQTWLRSCPHCAGGDALSQATAVTCAECGRRFHQRGNRTVNKHVGTVTKVLHFADERDWISKAPFSKDLPEDPEVRKDYLLTEVPGFPLEAGQRDEIAALYESMRIATWPAHDHPAPLLWRTWFTLSITYGMNPADLIDWKKNASPLLGSQVHWSARTPARCGRASNEHGWLSFVRTKTRAKKSGRIVVPLTRIAAAHLRALEPPGGWRESAHVIPWRRTNKKYSQQWRAFFEAADVPFVDRADLRNTMLSTWELFSPGVGKHVTGHSSVRDDERIINEHYLSAERQVVEAVQRFPYGPAFDWIFEHLGEQRTLF